ncbi:MAG: DUF4386 family protein [Anaerolineae bacterium]|nr:DUF4386 family protein [Anaerolineae bacterium]
MTNSENNQALWGRIYHIGGAAAIGAVLVGVLEIAITFLPGGNVSCETVLDWFWLFDENWFMGLRNMGLLNIMLDVLAILTYFALYAAHRQDRHKPYAAIAMIISFLGIGVFLATNRAFPMLALSNQYAAAATDAQRTVIEAAGQAMLSVGQSHTPGTFLGFILAEVAGIVISIVMLRSGIFSKASAYAGMLGFGILAIFEFLSSFIAGLSNVTMALAMFGGLLSMAWYILIARRLFQLARNPAAQ